MDEYIHIVCLDAPSPPDYGGAIDMYYKITSLADLGKKIILHYFNYQAGRNMEDVEKYCSQIHVYKRKSFIRSFSFSQPYIVASRVNKLLIRRLNKDNYPIILEGIHCSGILSFLSADRKIIIRIHNDESVYYSNLAKVESNIVKRFYFLWESRLLRLQQHKILKHYTLACLSEKDQEIFERTYGFKNLCFIPCFIPWQQLNIQKGKGDYCLYHGNMRIKENEAAALWLVQNVFNGLDYPLIIAGKGVSEKLYKATVTFPQMKIVNDPSMQELDQLIRNAHINVLPSFNSTGVKLKLLHAILEGRFCISNYEGLAGSKLTTGVDKAEAATSWIALIQEMMNSEFNEKLIEERISILGLYNNHKNAHKLSELL